MNNTGFNPNYAVPPGAVLEEWLQEHGMSQTELAERMGRPVPKINEIIKGKITIQQETALQLEAVTGVEASFWTNADRIYQERFARLEEEQRLESWVPWAKQFPFGEMVKNRWVEPVTHDIDRVRVLLRFFGTASPEAWTNVYGDFQTAFRQSPKFRSDSTHLAAWLRVGEIQAAQRECGLYDEARFKTALSQIRKITAAPADQAGRELMVKCAATGVVVVFVPELRQTHVCGATRWLSSTKALIQLSLRYKTDDQLWFTFFHEAAHILLHGKKEIFVEFDHADNRKEQEADRWASDFLIPPPEWRSFRFGEQKKASDIEAFARSLGIAPGIVVGRLQHEKIIPFAALNYLKQKLQLIPSESSQSGKN